jgi:hypothetical protein
VTAAHDAPPILSAAQEADAEREFAAWRDGLPAINWRDGGMLKSYAAWMAAWRACRHATLLEVERQRRDAGEP